MQRKSFAVRRRLLAAFGVGAVAPFLHASRAFAASGGLSGALSGGVSGEAAASGRTPRVVVLDWGLAAQVLALGVVPVGVARPFWYRLLSGTPEMPDSVVDVGLLFQPNFEVVQSLRPDLIVITPAHASLADSLSRIAPLFVAPPAHPHEDGYRLAQRRAHALGDALGRPAETARLLAQTDARLGAVRDRLAQHGATQRPIYLMSPIDTRLTNVFGRESVFGGTLAAVGLTNAWRRPSDTEGMAQIDYTQLGVDTAASAMLIGARPGLLGMLGQSPLWQALPFVRGARVGQLPMMLPTGGTPTAVKLADALSVALTGAAV
ncbi:Iron(3+)-hydroxamate-binding protein FhuD [Pandoraea capi]|uniref:Iron(3+)-hydroxamate-binding protein FhuD n=1 Tax=Pandoraea capi TaxID=2508286 RepID=A0ABY6W274_9BURK|nr:ABC transporter substrate-binding protein [Pandoraea capi]VVE16379.1 Iron(3+)-hydroxamate-binding protein FhuD [Pandoraea capi]